MATRSEPPAGRPHLDALVHPALARALAVARGLQGDPAAPDVPAALRPLLRFRRLTGPALAAARVALDDADFRAAVADGVVEADVDRPTWLYLARPDGWEDELAELVAELAEAEARRVDAAGEVEAERLRRLLAESDAERRTLQRALDDALGRSAALEAAQDALGADRAAAEAGAERATAERQQAVRDLKRVEAQLAARTAEVRDLREQRDRDGGGRGPAVSAGTVDEPAGPVLDPVELADRVAELDDRFSELGAALVALRSMLTDDLRPPARQPSRPVRSAARRRPVRPGRGLVEGTVDAAEALLRVPAIEVLVDGYNVAIGTWPDVATAERRRRLEQAATGLVARFGASITLVFDGTGSGGRPARSAPSAVRVRFTADGREADDEILELAAALPADVAVLVVSDDRRVVDGARSLGANVLPVATFMALTNR